MAVAPKSLSFALTRIIGQFGLLSLLAVSVSTSVAIAASQKDIAKARAWDCIEAAAQNLVSTTAETAEVLLPAVTDRCKKQLVAWKHQLAIEINKTQNIMIETSLVVTETQVSKQFEESLPPLVLAKIVEARSRINSADDSTGKKNTAEIPDAYGTGFLVSREGDLVSNAHVVENCKSVEVRNGAIVSDANVLGIDKLNDLAVLKISKSEMIPATIRSGKSAKAGEYVAVYGFPLPGALSDSGNLVGGNITALAGLGDDVRVYQISAPIQPGNSGGPLLDRYGNVAGIVNAKLDELLWAKTTGSLPQNVNFAIKSSVLTNFLDVYSVEYMFGKSEKALDLTDIGERAIGFTFQIVCRK